MKQNMMSTSLYRRTTCICMLLMACLSSLSQPDRKDSLVTSFTRYQSASVQEKLFVHVDKTFYLAGETIWFKAYDLDARSNTPEAISGIAYVEVIDRDQRPVLQEKIQLTNGKGDGSFKLPASLSSGYYTFRAYTNWMRNLSPDFYFLQQLTILNTLTDVSSADSSLRKDYSIRFLPEGGNLVNGLASVVAFKAADQSGKGITCRGLVIDQHKDTVAHFQTNRFGMGRFTFTPHSGNTYYAIVETDSSLLTEKLPAAYDQGYVMHLDNTEGNRLHIVVHSTSTQPGQVLYLFVHTRHVVRIVLTNYLSNNESSFLIDRDSLDDGVSHITLFNSDRMPVCERLYCKPPVNKLHIGVNTAAVEDSMRSGYGTRQKIAVHLSTTDAFGHPAAANLSMSAFLLDSLQPIPEDNILSYLLLSSDLKGKIESPQYYFSNTDPAAIEALDDLMLTQGWTRFRWKDILQDKKPYFEFLPETNGPIISGKVVDKHTGLAAPLVIGYLSVPGKQFKLSTAMSQTDGSLLFHLGNFYGNKEIIVQSNSQADSNYRIDISNSFSDRLTPLPLPDFRPSKMAQSQLLYRSINVQAENAYRTAEKHRFLPPSADDTTRFYGHADLKYDLDDYTRFVTMDEVIREYVDNVHVRRQSGNAYFRIRNTMFNTFFDDDPLLLIDGVPVFNGDKMIGINPLKIEKIDVISHKYYLGPFISDGILSFISYEGDLGGYQLDPGAVVIQFGGLQQHREFYSPVYETQAQVQSSIPDLRNQLLWSPEIDTDTAGRKQLTLYTSDLKGKFVLVVQGMTTTGLIGYSISTFSVGR